MTQFGVVGENCYVLQGPLVEISVKYEEVYYSTHWKNKRSEGILFREFALFWFYSEAGRSAYRRL